jgi:hypothetical protein
MTDTIEYVIWALADAVAPHLVANGIVSSGTQIPVQTTVYKRLGQLTDESARIGHVLSACPGQRGFTNDQISVEYDWDTVRRLSSAANMELRMTLRHDRPFLGERCTAAFRCVSGDE